MKRVFKRKLYDKLLEWKKKNGKSAILTLLVLTTVAMRAAAQPAPDPNFFIYLAIGQSNMAGGARPAEQGSVPADSRYRVMAAADDPRLGYKAGQWYPGREDGRLGLADFFGRTMVDNLPANIRVG